MTITYNLAPNTSIEEATATLEQAVAEMHIPDIIHADFSGDVQAFKRAVGAQPLLLLAALIAVYIVLGVLYEKPGASADHHLDVALGGSRRAARA